MYIVTSPQKSWWDFECCEPSILRDFVFEDRTDAHKDINLQLSYISSLVNLKLFSHHQT